MKWLIAAGAATGLIQGVQQSQQHKMAELTAEFNNTMNNISTQNQANVAAQNRSTTQANAMKASMQLQHGAAAGEADMAVQAAALGTTSVDDSASLQAAFAQQQIDIDTENKIMSIDEQQRAVETQNMLNRQTVTPPRGILEQMLTGGLKGWLSAETLGLGKAGLPKAE